MTRGNAWLTALAVLGGTAGLLAATLLWLLLTRPFAVAQALAGLG